MDEREKNEMDNTDVKTRECGFENDNDDLSKTIQSRAG